MTHTLYGDGVHDDYPAIQEMLDSGAGLVYLPPAQACYRISKTLKIHSNQEFRLDRYTRIKLLENSNCSMMENADPEHWDTNICISGGIWDMNHSQQRPNPLHYPDPATGLTVGQSKEKNHYDPEKRLFHNIYYGHCFRFNSIRQFTFRGLTIENPVVFGAQLAYVENFTVEDIFFDYYEGSPKLWNLDGVHCEGGCKNGVIRNLKGTCHDDMVALCADDDVHGPIENITVDGIYAENTHSAVRLLTYKSVVKNIHITNVYGTFYVYGINFSKYWGTPEDRGIYQDIVVDNVYASVCKGTVDVPGNYEPLIVVKEELNVSNLVINNVYRRESVCATPTIQIGGRTRVENLSISNCGQVNATQAPFPFLRNFGEIGSLTLSNVACGGDKRLVNEGNIERLSVT